MKRTLRVLLPAAAAALLLALAWRAGRQVHPSIVLITVDTLRPDHLGCYGHPGGTSPAIDRLFAEGTGFTTAIVPRGQTWPTLASILTSLSPLTHGVRKNGLPLPEDALTLARVLSRRGYATAAFLSNGGSVRWPGFRDQYALRDRDRKVVGAARSWIHAHAAGPFFLWVHLFAPHRPFRPPPLLADRFDPHYRGPVDGSIEQMERFWADRVELPVRDLDHLIALYDAEIRSVDGRIEELLGALRATGVEERTVVVFTADHGEELSDRKGYLSHSASIYDSVLRVPLLVRWPGRVAPGEWVEGIAEAIDLAPTILDLAGVAVPGDFEGKSLVPWVRRLPGGPPAGDRAAFSELEDRIASIRTRDYRFIHNPTGFDFPVGPVPYSIGREELYSHRDDPAERHDVAAEHPEIVRELRERILRWQDAHDWEESGRAFARREVPGEVRRELKAIGYVQ